MTTADAIDPVAFEAALARFDADLERALGFRSEATLRWVTAEQIADRLERGRRERGWEHGWEPEHGSWELEQVGSIRTVRSVVDALDEIQDCVIDSRRAAWPECPWHRSHPMKIVERDGDLWWECPADPTHSVVLGRFGLD